MYLHDVIKIRYVENGFLPDYPYHLIADDEMCDAFLAPGDEDELDFFHMTYPLQSDEYILQYRDLILGIRKEIDKFKEAYNNQQSYTIPDWVYSYMLGSVVGPRSSEKDRHDLLYALGVDNIDDIFNSEVYRAVYLVSRKSIDKLRYQQSPDEVRPPTIFGEPHVIKYLRTKQHL